MAKGERESTFIGTIQLNDIVLIQSSSMSSMKSNMIITGALAFLIFAQSYSTIRNEYVVKELTEQYTPPSSDTPVRSYIAGMVVVISCREKRLPSD